MLLPDHVPNYDLLTVQEVSGALRLSNALIYRMVKTGALPSIRIAGCIRIRREDVDALLPTRDERKGA